VGHFGGPTCAQIYQEAPICSSSQLSTMAVLSAQKVSAKKMWIFWEIGFWNFSSRKKTENSPKIQGGTHLNQLWKLSSPTNSASYDTKITPPTPWRLRYSRSKFVFNPKFPRIGDPTPKLYIFRKLPWGPIIPEILVFLSPEMSAICGKTFNIWHLTINFPKLGTPTPSCIFFESSYGDL